MMTAILRVLLTVLVVGGAWPGQATFRLLEPTEETILTGPVTFRVGLSGGTLKELVIQIDGVEVCRRTAPPFECQWNAGASLDPRVVRAVATLATGERLVNSVRTKGLRVSDRSDVASVLVSSHVTDSSGRFVTGLTADDFRVLDEGVPQKVNLVDAGEGGAEILLALDLSGSMADEIDDLKLVAREFLDRLRPVDKPALMGFNSAFFLLAARDADRPTRLRAIAELSASGGTAIYDTIINGAEQLAAHPGRRAMVVFTDGDDQSSRSTLESARAALHAQDSLLYLVSTASDTDRRRELSRLATETGGAAYFAGRLSATSKHFREVVDDIAQQYLLAFAPEKPLGDGKWRRLTVEMKNRALRVRARSGYFATKRGG